MLVMIGETSTVAVFNNARRCCARAAELFDWLRQLPETHELAHLCDVYTYTTAISHVRPPSV